MTEDQKKFFDRVWPTFLHIPYLWGGDSPSEGLDCSGLVIELLTSVGSLPGAFDTTAQGLWSKLGPKAEVMPADVRMGDLAFFGATVKTITHVGFCLSNTLMLEAGGGNRSMTTIQSAINGNGRVRVRPIDNRRDLIGFRRPEYLF